MTEQTAAERLLRKALSFDPKKESVSPRVSKLLLNIANNKELWLSSYFTLSQNLAWASEVTLLGLTKEEVSSVQRTLELMGISGVELGSPADYKAIVILSLKSLLQDLETVLEKKKREVEEYTFTLLRYDLNGIIASGYTNGIPLTSYVSSTSCFHKVYLENEGAFSTASSALDIPLSRENPLVLTVEKVEKMLPKIRETWTIWKKKEALLSRIRNLGTTADANGGLM